MSPYVCLEANLFLNTHIDHFFRQEVLLCLETEYELFVSASWLFHTSRVLVCFQLKEALITMGLDSPPPHPDYVPTVGTIHDHDLGHETTSVKGPYFD